MRLEVGVALEGNVDAPAHRVELLRHLVARPVVGGGAARTVRRDLGHRRLVEVDGLIEEPRAVLQDDDALFEVVVDLRSVVLDLLLQLREVVARLDLHKEEDDAGDDAEDPEDHLEDHRADARLDGDLLFDDVHVASLPVDGAVEFVEFVCHLCFLLI